MDLKSFLPHTDKEKEKEYFWSLIIEPGWVQAGVWDIEGEKAEVISISPTTAWETEGELLGAADAALSAAVQNLPDTMVEPTKTVFGVNPSWVGEGQIKPEYLERIRKICSDLSLSPVGFVVLPEAISHLTKVQEGAPLNACVLGIGKDTLEIALFRLGNLVGASQIARSVSMVDDVAEGLARFSGSEAFPSRIILYNGKEGELEEVKQTLLNVSWESFEKIKFLHSPKVEIIPPEKKILAVCLAGASEIANVTGVSAAKVIGGVVREEVPGQANISLPEEDVNPEELGFVLGKDVTSIPKVGRVSQTAELLPSLREASTPKALPQKLEVETPAVDRFGFVRNFRFPQFAFLKNFKASLPKPGLSFPGKKVLTFGVISLAIIFILGFVAWWFLPKALVTIYVSPQKLEERTEATVDPEADALNFSEKIIPGKVLTTNVSGERTKATTGTKTVGDKAKGNVIIQNGTASAINLAAGTILVSNSGFKYVLDASVSIPAAISPSNPGTTTVDVVADSIGAEYNLAKDEVFDVGNYPRSEVDAIATSDFTGGSSRQIPAVSDEDQSMLEEELLDELMAKAKDDLSQKVGENETFITESAVSTLTEKTFGNKVGDEVEILKLDLAIDVKGLSVSQGQLTDLAMETLKGKVPDGYILREGQIASEFEFLEESGGGAKVMVLFRANLLPEVNPDEIAKEIAGKYPSLAEDYLTNIRGFSRAEIKINPSLPGKLKSLPRISRNIEIEIAAE
ncbi:hypothetical protein A2V97_03935 [Candidatus Woesebacteria bacterium RBG_16_42_24]|uniref:Baseplate protein J-like domain-containing protein n=1 Tax=Candidatus Woesebacteria bacterium RBG_16_42_24 TaxID=1802485 RepID=A0A1F7XM60_9BACT|nr:MAG: hypothetical protein A2V97_03935 [Candidatus Woesebacteria bacterium RBG_16_42_24]